MIRQLLSVLALQLGVTLVVAAVSGYLAGGLAARSAAIGGLIAVVPGAFYAWRLIRTRHLSPQRMLGVHYAAEFGKLALTFVLFGAVFAWMKEVSVLSLFAAYIATLLVYWPALMMFNRV
jgi:ATP synthase protein I